MEQCPQQRVTGLPTGSVHALGAHGDPCALGACVGAALLVSLGLTEPPDLAAEPELPDTSLGGRNAAAPARARR